MGGLRLTERVRETTRKTFGTYAVDARTGLRRRVIQELYIREDGVASGSARMLFEEMCGDEAYASEVIARREHEAPHTSWVVVHSARLIGDVLTIIKKGGYSARV